MTRVADVPPGAHILEHDFQEALRRALCGAGRKTRCWRQNVGEVVRRDRSGKSVGTFRSGPVVGAADLSGIAGLLGPGDKPIGKRLEIEVKVDHEWTAEQIHFSEMITRLGGIYILIRYDHGLSLVDNVAAALAKVDKAIIDSCL